MTDHDIMMSSILGPHHDTGHSSSDIIPVVSYNLSENNYFLARNDDLLASLRKEGAVAGGGPPRRRTATRQLDAVIDGTIYSVFII